MSSRRWRFAAFAAFFPALAAASEAASHVRWGELPCSPDGWCFEYPDRPGLESIHLVGVHGASPTRVWAVGGSGQPTRGVIARWDGTAWDEAATTPEFLFGVWSSGHDDAWAVGANGAILHWDGAAWSPAASPTREILARVGGSGRDDVWAVGYRGTVLHRDARGWSIVPSGTQVALSCVWAPRSGEAWLGGDGVLLRWSGGRLEAIPGAPQRISGVGPVSGGAVAVVTREGRVARWDGARWSTLVDEATLRRAFPWLEGPIQNVWFEPSGAVWAAGPRYGTMLYLDGNTWRVVPGPGRVFPLSDVWGSGPGDVWAVGMDAIARWDGRAWSLTMGGPRSEMGKVWATGPDDVWAVADGGLVLHRSGSHWTRAPSPTTDRLTAVFGTAPNDVWVSGNAIWHWDGSRWETSLVPSPPLAMWGMNRNDVWAVGETVLHWDGDRWTKVAKIDGHLSAVWGSGPRDVWAVGSDGPPDSYGARNPPDDVPEHGIVWRWDGTRATTTKLGARLNAVWGSGPDDIYAAGEGEMHHWNGRAWRAIDAPFAPIHDLWGRGRSELWAVGTDGRVARWDGKSWETRSVGTFPLVGVTGTRGRVWVSGGWFILGRDRPRSAGPGPRRPGEPR